MNTLSAKWRSCAPYILSLIRIVAALIFMTSGTMKIWGWPGPMPEGMTFQPLSQMGVGAFLEVGGGALLALGLCTRPIAFVLAGMMAIAYFQFHAPHSFWPTINQGTPAILFCFLWLYISAAGGGPLSIDALLGKDK